MEAKDDGGEGKSADEGKSAGGGGGGGGDGDERSEEVADEAVLMECLGMIEDMFFDEVDLDDGFGDSDDEGGAWNQAESKEGASLREEIRALEDRAADSFRDKIASDAEEKHGGGGGGTEFTLEQSDLHRQFCELVESRLDTCLRKQGRSADDLLAAIKRIDGRPSSGTSYLSMASREIVTMLHEVRRRGSVRQVPNARHRRLSTTRLLTTPPACRHIGHSRSMILLCGQRTCGSGRRRGSGPMADCASMARA